ncbi:MAG: alanine--tRNA ligase [Patescibacteria group bacterium]
MITAQILRTKYLDFFKSKNHTIIDSASLLPENDPTVLFTTAGMHPLVPFLLGEKHPGGNRIANAQKCIRTGDIDEVGDDTHLTFFEMMGNWSMGDYFKEDAIKYSWEFLTSPEWLGIDPSLLAVTVFEGEDGIPRDTEAADIWKSLGVPEHKIAYLGREDNWWGPAGQTGPCGPDTEMFYWVGEGAPPEDSNPGTDEENWMEIWNDVFMQYNKTPTGEYEPLAQKNVDTGLGLERVTVILNGHKTVYEVDTLKPIYTAVQELTKDTKNEKAIRVITDHIRAAVMIMGDNRGVGPSNVDQGYVVRRLIRVSIRRGRELGITDAFIPAIAKVVIDTMGGAYPEIVSNKDRVLAELKVEEEKFSKVLEKGEEAVKKFARDGVITGEEAFTLYATYGFPVEEITRLGVKVDMDDFNKRLEEHQKISRKGAEGKFAGGLADHSTETTQLHTATHLLHAALREVLGDHVVQKGSNITKDRLRFDFSHGEKMTDEEKQAVETWVNDKIKAAHPVHFAEMSVEEAKEKGAMGLFTQKYGDMVKVYTVGDDDNPVSREICGGPHVENTKDLGKFRIKKEEASSAGVRRIKAILE